MALLKQYYTTIYCTAHSSCGDYLAAGSNNGIIAIFNLLPFLENDEIFSLETSYKYPFFKFPANVGPVFSIVSSKQILICGGVGEIKAWKWSDLKKKVSKPLWTFVVTQEGSYTQPEINTLILSKEEDFLYAGCGDNKVYCIDVEKYTELFSLIGHTDYIHCVDLSSTSQEIASGSEDGSVRVWDARCPGSSVHIIEPHKHEMASRNNLGKWIGCVAFDPGDDWLVCGGAPNLCVWHIRALQPLTKMPKKYATHSVVRFCEDRILSGGSEGCINHWGLDGILQIEVPTSGAHVFSLDMHSSNAKQFLVAAGSSYKIDVCTNYQYKDFSLIFADQ